jgi:hypothetical protein
LLVASSTTASPTINLTSPSGNQVGAWLKDVPANSNHYSIFVANDGTGDIEVLNSTGAPVTSGTPPAPMINNAAACNQVS